ISDIIVPLHPGTIHPGLSILYHSFYYTCVEMTSETNGLSKIAKTIKKPQNSRKNQLFWGWLITFSEHTPTETSVSPEVFSPFRGGQHRRISRRRAFYIYFPIRESTTGTPTSFCLKAETPSARKRTFSRMSRIPKTAEIK